MYSHVSRRVLHSSLFRIRIRFRLLFIVLQMTMTIHFSSYSERLLRNLLRDTAAHNLGTDVPPTPIMRLNDTMRTAACVHRVRVRTGIHTGIRVNQYTSIQVDWYNGIQVYQYTDIPCLAANEHPRRTMDVTLRQIKALIEVLSSRCVPWLDSCLT